MAAKQIRSEQFRDEQFDDEKLLFPDGYLEKIMNLLPEIIINDPEKYKTFKKWLVDYGRWIMANFWLNFTGIEKNSKLKLSLFNTINVSELPECPIDGFHKTSFFTSI